MAGIRGKNAAEGMDEFKVESGIPLPETIIRSRYPFHKMKVGDSFAVSPLNRSGVASSALAYGRRQDPEWKFITRKTNETELRVWRIK